jgi:hypothetical protein
MKPEAQQIAIAEVCGWALQKWTGIAPASYPFTVVNPNGVNNGGWATERGAWSHGTPDYLRDLNAMHEAWTTLNRREQQKFAQIVYSNPAFKRTNGAGKPINCRYLAFGITANFFAECFLKAKGLWQEEEKT